MLLPYLTLSNPILHRYQYYYYFTDEELDLSKLNGLTRLRMLINGRRRTTPKSVQQVFEKCCFLQCHSLITLMRQKKNKKKKRFSLEAPVYVEFASFSPCLHVFVFFSPEGGGLPRPKDGAPEVNWRVYSIPG